MFKPKMQAAVGRQMTEDAANRPNVVNFMQGIPASPDLSGEVRKPRGRPRKQKEI